MSSNKLHEFIYKEANIKAEELTEQIIPILKNALMETYAKGFIKAMSIYEKNINKQNGTNKGLSN